ncbi:MAG: AraC family transcriptional regulator [Deltaproteobacteria bacterium]|nr:AraC family transcriptional regulator [Deltaproteobacteria bacterium]
MVVHARVPSAPLAGRIGCLWEQAGPRPGRPVECVVPSASCAIVIALHDEPLRVLDRDGVVLDLGSAIFSGPQTKPLLIGTGGPGGLIGVHFLPGGAYPSFGVPAVTLRDLCVPLDALWGAEVAKLRTRLLEARGPEARFALLERALLGRRSTAAAPHPAVRFGLGALSSGRVAAVTAETGLSARRFGELFQREVGPPPKLFARLCRFQRVLRHLDGEGAVSWAGVAASHGYADQAHLIRDFREFVGITPTDFLGRRTGQQNHVVAVGSNSFKTRHGATS